MSLIKQHLYEKMTSNLSVTNLKYEELILLQEIMMDVWEFGIDAGRAQYNKEDFDNLYDKIMSS